MQVTVSEISPVEKKVAVEIEWNYVAQKLDEAYKDLSRGVALKGFRKGKVPRPMLEKMFGRQVEQEVVKQLVQESFVTAAQQHDIQPVAEPIVDDAHLHKGKPFHYSARVEVRSIAWSIISSLTFAARCSSSMPSYSLGSTSLRTSTRAE